MNFFTRTLVIWLLALAVPAQGVAAATMASCGLDHHGGSAATQAQAAAPAEHSQHSAVRTAAHEHHDQAAQADDDASAPASSVIPAEGGGANTHKCSACASCCSIGAILSSMLTVPAPAFNPTVFTAVVLSVDAFAAEGPDRPPRIVFA